jgi:hypothetical protein
MLLTVSGQCNSAECHCAECPKMLDSDGKKNIPEKFDENVIQNKIKKTER